MGVLRREEQPAAAPVQWSERTIAGALARQTFQRKAIVLVPNCSWTGYECDLLVVEQRLRIIDVEVKISRSDLKADAKKDKWWQRFGSSYAGVDENGKSVFRQPPPNLRQWPPRVWKHYYAMPADIWKPELLDCLPSPSSGVITLSHDRHGSVVADVVRRATPNRDAAVLTPEQAVDVARLANLRLWDAYSDAGAQRQRAQDWEARARELGFKFDWEK